MILALEMTFSDLFQTFNASFLDQKLLKRGRDEHPFASNLGLHQRARVLTPICHHCSGIPVSKWLTTLGPNSTWDNGQP